MVAWTNKCSSSVPPAEMTVEWLYTMLKYRGDQLDLLTAEVYELKKEAVEWKRREEKLQSKIEEATNKAEVAAGEAYEACREGEQMHRDMCEGMEKEVCSWTLTVKSGRGGNADCCIGWRRCRARGH